MINKITNFEISNFVRIEIKNLNLTIKIKSHNNKKMSEQKNEFKPGHLALVAIKQQNKAVELFKRPRQVENKKKTKHVILTEEKYLSVCKKTLEKYFSTKKLMF